MVASPSSRRELCIASGNVRRLTPRRRGGWRAQRARGSGAAPGGRVLDLTHYIAGPYCTKWLATLGADVVKVERPASGDGARRFPPFPVGGPHLEKSGFVLYLNTGRRSLSFNLKAEKAREILLQLVQTADVVVENFRPGVMENLGLEYERLADANPWIVLASVSNFGQTGPYRDLRATEIVLFGMCGLMSIIGFEDEPPLKRLAQ